jgi:hypothetical protein
MRRSVANELEAFGAKAEMIGGVAVFVTVVYLAQPSSGASVAIVSVRAGYNVRSSKQNRNAL